MSDMLLIEELKRIVRVRSVDAEFELEGLVASCEKEMEIVGIYGDETDPLYRQAIRLYCKAHYGYDEDAERFREAFDSLRDAMALSGDYAKEAADGSNIDMGQQDQG